MTDLITFENVKKIIDIGLAIKEVVETARRNEKECRNIMRDVDRVCRGGGGPGPPLTIH